MGENCFPALAADRLDSSELWVQRVTGVPMEPRAAVGEWDAASDRYTVHADGFVVYVSDPAQARHALLRVPLEHPQVVAAQR